VGRVGHNSAKAQTAFSAGALELSAGLIGLALQRGCGLLSVISLQIPLSLAAQLSLF
jgi:hypothetical protein